MYMGCSPARVIGNTYVPMDTAFSPPRLIAVKPERRRVRRVRIADERQVEATEKKRGADAIPAR
jgi:hypothetical protein